MALQEITLTLSFNTKSNINKLVIKISAKGCYRL